MCGCTEAEPCTTPDGPCYWLLVNADLCSACVVVVVLKEERLVVPKMCRHCDLVETENLHYGKAIFTCSKGRFGKGSRFQWYALSGIEQPNKTVAEAQKRCPFFEVHRKYKEEVPR